MVLEVTIVGSGSPIPTTQRGGTALAITLNEETLLVDCGPGTVEGLLENRIHPGRIESLFLTHHHMDHNAGFFHFAIGSWLLGREALRVYGPSGTGRLVDGLGRLYAEDFTHREELGRSLEPVTAIETRRIGDESVIRGNDWSVTARRVDHSIETYGYRIDTPQGVVVFSADTAKSRVVEELAAGADVLIHDALLAPASSTLPTGESHLHTILAPTEAFSATLHKSHSTVEEAAEVATAAGVRTLVLTHLWPNRDEAAMRAAAKAIFDGTVLIAEDGLTLSSPF